MKIFYLALLTAFFLVSNNSAAQVGISTSTPQGALDITSTTSGIVIPRVVLTSKIIAAPVVNPNGGGIPVDGTLIYNTLPAGVAPNNVVEGFYYWDNSMWNAFTGAGSKEWSVDGNAGTVAGTNYLGTTDAQDLRFRTQGNNKFNIGNTSGQLSSFTLGTAAAPVYSWNADLNTGIFSPLADNIGYTTNGTERMRVNANGQVVVNSIAPLAADRFSVYNTVTSDFAVNGYSTLTGVGVYGQNVGTGRGVQGTNSGTGRGVIGFSNSTGYGVAGQNSATGIGTAGFSVTSGIGVYGQNTGNGTAIQGVNNNVGDGLQVFQTGIGDAVYLDVLAGFGMYNVIRSNNFGIYNDLSFNGGTGFFADLENRDGEGFVFDNVGLTNSNADGFGYFATVNTATPSGAFVNGALVAGTQSGLGHGILINHSGTQGRNAEFNINNALNTEPALFAVTLGRGSAVLGQNQNNVLPATISVADFAYTGTDVDDHIGVSGFSAPAAGWGVGVEGAGNFIGVSGVGGDFGVFSTGDFGASGVKFFVIDHPSDPANKYLRHANIESNEVLNFYRGTAIFDASGKATVSLPSYYEAINKNASYQLTPVGAAMPNVFVEQEISNGTFVIAGGIAGKKVSWNVTAERNDLYMQNNPGKRENEVGKGERSGKYISPELYGQPKENGITFKDNHKHQTSVLPQKTKTKSQSKGDRTAKKAEAATESDTEKEKLQLQSDKK